MESDRTEDQRGMQREMMDEDEKEIKLLNVVCPGKEPGARLGESGRWLPEFSRIITVPIQIIR